VSQVFVSYKREDELRVGRIARALEQEGLDIWWDRGLPGGESWHTNIESKLQDARCVVVVWSANSSGQEGGYVREEARRGLSRNILVPVLIDAVKNLPLGFGEIQALDLTRWHGDRRDPYFVDLVATIRAKLANAPLPPPKGPTGRITRRLMWGSLSGAGLSTAALLAFNTFNVASRVCTIPGPQPGLSDTCGALNLGARPSRAERLAWASRSPGSCPALREYVARFPDGIYRAEAADLLTARKTSVLEKWQAAKRGLALFEPADGPPAKDEATARVNALGRAQAGSDRLCRAFGAGTIYRYVSSRAVAEHWTCNKIGAGVVCGLEGQASCELSERLQIETEQCG
jgi:hypothetical protein